MTEKTNSAVAADRGAVEMTLCGKPLRAFPQSLEIAPRFPHSHSFGDCYYLSELQFRKGFLSTPPTGLQAHSSIGKGYQAGRRRH